MGRIVARVLAHVAQATMAIKLREQHRYALENAIREDTAQETAIPLLYVLAAVPVAHTPTQKVSILQSNVRHAQLADMAVLRVWCLCTAQACAHLVRLVRVLQLNKTVLAALVPESALKESTQMYPYMKRVSARIAQRGVMAHHLAWFRLLAMVPAIRDIMAYRARKLRTARMRALQGTMGIRLACPHHIALLHAPRAAGEKVDP